MLHIDFDLRQRDPSDIMCPHRNRYRKGGPVTPLPAHRGLQPGRNNRYGARYEGAEPWPSEEGFWVTLPIIQEILEVRAEYF
jgi:hypothetical protein